MTGWWVHEYYQAGLTIVLVSHLFWVILSIVLHELSHGWAALWQGDDTPRRLGRLTLNPLVHMGGWSLLMLLAIGLAWGAMPVDPSRFRWRRKGRLVVAAAGPAMNLLLVVGTLIGLALWIRFVPPDQSLYQNVAAFLFVGAELNILLAIFNLLPIPPLDGSEMLSGLSFRWWRLFQHERAPMIGLFIVLVLMFGGVTDYMWIGAYRTTLGLGDLIGACLGNQPLYDVIPYTY